MNNDLKNAKTWCFISVLCAISALLGVASISIKVMSSKTTPAEPTIEETRRSILERKYRYIGLAQECEKEYEFLLKHSDLYPAQIKAESAATFYMQAGDEENYIRMKAAAKRVQNTIDGRPNLL